MLQRRRETGAKTPRKGRGPLRMVALAVLVLILGAVGWFALSLFQPFKGDGEGSVAVRIPTGASVGQIADLLAAREVISSPFFFQARATVSGRRDDFKAGRFTLRRGMSNAAAMDAISEGPPADVVRVAVPEGRSRREVDRIVGNRLRGDYITATRRSPQLDPAPLRRPRATPAWRASCSRPPTSSRRAAEPRGWSRSSSGSSSATSRAWTWPSPSAAS